VATDPQRLWEEEDPEEGEEDWGLADLPARRQARALVIQVLFEVDTSGHSLEEAMEWALEEVAVSEETSAFTRRLAQGVLKHREELDRQIQRFAPTWPVSQLASVDRNLLRLAIYELTQETGPPPKVAINEAVELAKLFGTESTPRFVNGVLGAVMENLVEAPKG